MKFKSKGEIAYRWSNLVEYHTIPEVIWEAFWKIPIVWFSVGWGRKRYFKFRAFSRPGIQGCWRALYGTLFRVFNQNPMQRLRYWLLLRRYRKCGGHGFYKVPGVEVVILYPKGKVSAIQEKQLTTLGEKHYCPRSWRYFWRLPSHGETSLFGPWFYRSAQVNVGKLYQ